MHEHWKKKGVNWNLALENIDCLYEGSVYACVMGKIKLVESVEMFIYMLSNVNNYSLYAG